MRIIVTVDTADNLIKAVLVGCHGNRVKCFLRALEWVNFESRFLENYKYFHRIIYTVGVVGLSICINA